MARKTTTREVVSVTEYRAAKFDLVKYVIEKLFHELPDADLISIELIKLDNEENNGEQPGQREQHQHHA